MQLLLCEVSEVTLKSAVVVVVSVILVLDQSRWSIEKGTQISGDGSLFYFRVHVTKSRASQVYIFQDYDTYAVFR